uniref:Uncharacterized protein n=1 Tax=Rhizophora mucronata TaxID=61149 RepID=A0A2P2MKN3_RHIMU
MIGKNVSNHCMRHVSWLYKPLDGSYSLKI